MQPAALLSALVELAQEAGLVVRTLPRGAAREGDPPATSGLCRVRGEDWVLLAASDPVAQRIDAVADALRRCRSGFLEERYLPPAVRECLEHEPPRAPETAPSNKFDPG